jgi:hypothetical protein
MAAPFRSLVLGSTDRFSAVLIASIPTQNFRPSAGVVPSLAKTFRQI